MELGRRIPTDHLLRRISQVIDLSFVRREVADFYGGNGQVSVDPEVIVKLMLLLFLDNVRSERELMRVVPLRLDYLWFLGYRLEDEVPGHSVLSKARKRWGGEVFASLFARTIGQCVEAGLVAGEKLHVDASLVTADASRNSVIEVLVEQEVAKLDELPLEDRGPVNRQRRSRTDGDSTVVRHRDGKSTPSYKNHRVLDDRAGVITALATTTGAVDEARELAALIDQHESRTQTRARVVIADSRYGNSANLITLARRGVRAHVADLRQRMRNVRALGIFPAEVFTYEAAADQFRCPAGQALARHHFHVRRGYYEYRAARGVCSACALRTQCTRDKTGRTLKRYAEQDLLDQARSQSHSEAARLDRKRRQWFQERNFGEAATQHGFKRARWRGLWRQSIQDHLIAAIQNLRILARHQAKNPPAPLSSLAMHAHVISVLLKRAASNLISLLASLNRCQFHIPCLAFGQQPVDNRY
jgi:transposase